MLTGSDENLLDEDLDNEEIIEGLKAISFILFFGFNATVNLVMMVAGHNLGRAGEHYSDSELGEEEEEEEYSDEVIDEFESDEAFVPKTFEDFQTLFKKQFEPTIESEEDQDVAECEPQSVDREMEKRVEQALLQMPAKSVVKRSPEPETDEGPLSQEDDYEHEEPDDLSGDKVLERHYAIN